MIKKCMVRKDSEMNVLVVNAGSSSIKYQLFDTATGAVRAKGVCERIGCEGSCIEHRKGEDGEKIKRVAPMENHAQAMKVMVNTLTDPEIGVIRSMNEIEAVGHRIVHGGPYFFGSELVTEEVIAKLELCKDLAPLHTVPHLMGIRGCLEVMPGIPQVVVFDTAFHQTMPPKAYYYPIPYQFYEKYKIRRYGFHGTSHRFVSGEMCKILGRVEGTKIITCHIGNGASIAAVKDGKCVDTSMGFTPLDGLEMGTRCGSIDPAIVPFLMKKEGLSPDQMNELMNKKCGFLGITEFSSDSRDLEEAIALHDNEERFERATLATSVMAYQVQKYIGSYTAAMNGLDALVFTAGLGENNPKLRERVCSNMEFFGIEIDREINDRTLRQPNIVELSTKNSRVRVFVIPTNEELVIASDTEAIVKKL